MRKIWFVAAAGLLVAVGLMLFRYTGDDGWPPHDGNLRQTVKVQVDGLRRSGPGTIALTATALYTVRGGEGVSGVNIPSFSSVALSLIDRAGAATPVSMSWRRSEQGTTRALVWLPAVPDGDYQLRVAYKTRLGPGQVDVALPLYAPARIHVITDRPLYEPGNLVRFRAVVLRANDLVPLDGRPGTWAIRDPSGEVVLEERSAAGAWGVLAGTFPLDAGAETGDWKLAWRSGDAVDEVAFTVKPFTLPRFRVEASAERPYYHRLDKPKVRGAVTYSSGAPVAGAELAIEWQLIGDWPPPTSWMTGELPKVAVAGANGRFEIALPEVPADLQDQVTLVAQISATDPAGDRVESSARVLMSADRIAVSAVTEIGDGLVDGSNNRIYLRVTTPDGHVLPEAKINVKRAWQGDDPGVDASLDVDGVASLQLDPGPPVNVVIPAAPYRAPVRQLAVTRADPSELISGEGAPLADQLELDRWLAPMGACTRYNDSGGVEDVEVGLRVASNGAVAAVAGDDGSLLAGCALQVLRGRRLAAGPERLYSLTFSFAVPPGPTLDPTVESAVDLEEAAGDQLEAWVGDRALRARDCLPANAEGSLPRVLSWQRRRGSKELTIGPWIADGSAEAPMVSAAVMACIAGRMGGARLALNADAGATDDDDGLGVIRFAIATADVEGEERPQPTTILGYELLVTAELPGAETTKATTRLRLTPGTVPPLRLRVAPVLASAGQRVSAELIRGPGFASSGQTLPKELVLTYRHGTTKEKVDDQHQATLTIPGDAEGWCEISGGGQRALVYVRPPGDLSVAVTPKRTSYAPGQLAELQVQTLIGGQGRPAAVGLFGVDDSLGQLATLRGADDLARIQPQVETTTPAFGTLDGQALVLGRIRGVNAAAATVLRVGAIPSRPELDAVVSASGETRFDAVEELTDHFYNVLAELHAQARSWELAAPAGELMKPPTMAKLWKQALAACVTRGEPVTDAFGRKLRLSRLPRDLLALTDPRAVIIVGTRLPEDVEDWAAWVAKEKP